MKTKSYAALALVTVMALTACNLPTPVPPAPAPTADPGMVGTIAAMTLVSMLSPTPNYTPTPKPTITVTPTVTPTYSIPMAQFDGDTNCREGPGTNYEVVTVVRGGQQAEIVGLPSKGNYWVIKNPNGEGKCWVAGDYARISGSIQALPTIVAPPTPTPIPPSAPTWKTWNYSCEFASGGSNVTVSLIWTDHSNNEDGFYVYRNDEVAANLAPDTTSFTDVTFLASGQSVTYSIEVYNEAGRARSTKTEAIFCQ